MAVLLSIFPGKTGPVLSTSRDYLMEMVWILPAVMILMGLFKVWISREMVVKYLGKASGLKGILIAVALGSTPTGPLYVAFPLAVAMLKKGARVMNIIVFLSAWACIKLPQEMVELQFLGLNFMVTRLILTIILVSVMGFFIEQVIEKTDIKGIKDEI
ncbi:hypothetical protein AKJ62_02470 [candidate division MSBL1 archaeon SCGC-AAA259D14]|uniref:Permease n=2 Tax=candidate division MSBL1 TaxID=215777 RepID=A0A133U6B7_9EURY|nr:hypothetical protein AKJ62_02470 [candidate division MSBL1 archaeon SCGC-AAA259D14]KXA93821.1 hypothetical protein AKJ66_00815 [candidate division MSBL1 archaeon SCGC-AAA259E22]